MTFDQFSELNRLRCEAPAGFNHKLDHWTLSDWFTATLGELGEAANVVKKLNRIRDGIPGNKWMESEEKLRDEQAVGFLLGDVVMEVFNAKSALIGYRK